MDAAFLDFISVSEVLFTCHSCGWTGSECELDINIGSLNNMVCCPSCHDDDVRVLNN